MDKVSKAAARFKQVRAELKLTQQQLADRLFLSRNYIAKIESGKKEPSVRALNALEALLVEKEYTQSTPSPHSLDGMVQEDPAENAGDLKRRVRRHLEELLAAAGNDVQRLGWIAEQMHQHLEEPVHWGVHERVIKQVLDEQKKKRELAAKAAQSSKGAAAAEAS